MIHITPNWQETGLTARIADSGGSGVVWVHGYTLDSSIWSELWSLLPDWRHVGIDLPHHGEWDSTESAPGLQELAERIGAAMRAEEIHNLVAISFGGVVALQIARHLGRYLEKLVLASPALAGGLEDAAAQTRNLALIRLYRQRGPGPWMRELWMRSPSEIFAGAAARVDLWKRLIEVVARHRWGEMADGWMSNLHRADQSRAFLRRIEAATLILVGEHDMPVFKRTAQLIYRAIPNCRRCYVPDCGHLTMLEVPRDGSRLVGEHLNGACAAKD